MKEDERKRGGSNFKSSADRPLSWSSCAIPMTAESRDTLSLDYRENTPSHGEILPNTIGTTAHKASHRFKRIHPGYPGHLLNDLRCRLCDLLSALDYILDDAGSDYMAQRGLGAFDKRLSHVCNVEGGFVWRDDSVVNNRGEMGPESVHTSLGPSQFLNTPTTSAKRRDIWSLESDLWGLSPHYA